MRDEQLDWSQYFLFIFLINTSTFFSWFMIFMHFSCILLLLLLIQYKISMHLVPGNNFAPRPQT